MKLILSIDPSSFYSVSIDGKESSFEAKPLTPPPTENDTSSSGSVEPRIVGSCRGLVCLNSLQGPILWNPCTKTHHQIPEPDYDSDFQQRENWRCHVVQGLGYDELNDDYKLLRVYQYLGPPNGANKYDSKVLVYSLKADSWERVTDFPYFVHSETKSAVFVNGALHFHASTKNSNAQGDDTVASDCIIAAFDVSNHTYKRVTRHSVRERKYDIQLGVLGGSLSLIRNNHDGISQCMVMKEYGVKSSWTALFRVEMDAPHRLRFRPITYLGGEKRVIVETSGMIFCFDVQSKSCKKIEIDGINQASEFFVYMESEVVLGSVDINDKIQQQVKEENREQANKQNLESKAVLGNVDGATRCNKRKRDSSPA